MKRDRDSCLVAKPCFLVVSADRLLGDKESFRFEDDNEFSGLFSENRHPGKLHCTFFTTKDLPSVTPKA